MPNYVDVPPELYDEMVESFGPWHALCYQDRLFDALCAVGGVEDEMADALASNPKAFAAPVYSLSLTVN